MFVRTFANTSLALGTLLLVYSGALAFQRYNPSRLAFKDFSVSAAAIADYNVYPTRIVIQSVGIDTPIIPIQSYDNKWEVTAEGAAYLNKSPLPGTPGNSIIYGHNWTAIFGSLVNVKPGDFIEIYMNNGERKIFGVTATQTIDPSNTSVLKTSSDRHLTVYTCSGFLDSKRFVVSATLQSQIGSN